MQPQREPVPGQRRDVGTRATRAWPRSYAVVGTARRAGAGSERGPGQRRPAVARAAGTRLAGCGERPAAGCGRAPCAVSSSREPLAQLAARARRASRSRSSSDAVVERVAGPAPQHRAQLLVLAERHAVVDAVRRPARRRAARGPAARARPCGRRCSPTSRSTHMRRRSGSSACTSVTGRPPSPCASSTSSQPAGRGARGRRRRRARRRAPSRRPVGRGDPRLGHALPERPVLAPGRGRHEVPAEGRATPRRPPPRAGRASSPGKSHSGRSPAVGL